MFQVTLISFLEMGETRAVLCVDGRRTNVALGTGAFFDTASVVIDLDSDFDPREAARRDRALAMAGLFLVGRDAKGGAARRGAEKWLR